MNNKKNEYLNKDNEDKLIHIKYGFNIKKRSDS